MDVENSFSTLSPFKGCKLISPYDKIYYNMGSNVFLAIRVSNPSLIPHFVKKLTTECLVFSLKSDGINLIPDTSEVKVHDIPKGHHPLRHVVNWMSKNHPPFYAERLGNTAAGDDTIVVTWTHLCGDGGYINELIKNLNSPIKKLPSVFPTTVEELFVKDLSRNDPLSFSYNHPRLSVLPSPHPRGPKESHATQSVNVFDLPSYDQKRKQCVGINELKLTSWVLSAYAFNGELDRFGLSTCIDLRRFYIPKGKLDFTYCNLFGEINLFGPENWKSATVGECWRVLSSAKS
jgi:hypothetical protein